jgi:hypothetical protein
VPQTPLEAQKIMAEVASQAMTDKVFRERLAGNPESVLKEKGLEIPAGITVKAISNFEAIPAPQDTPNVLHVMIPSEDPHAELSQEELSAVAGGGTCDSTAGTAFTIPSCVSTVSTKSTRCP